MSLYLVLFHVQDAAAKPIAGASASAVSPNGDWSSTTNPCGDVIDPGSGLAGVMLSPGQYTVTFSAVGYQPRVLPVTILAEGPPIRVGLDRAASVLPAPPTRAQLCGIECAFQGLSVQTQQYGLMPWFEPALGWLALASDRDAVYDVKRAEGDTHINLTISGQYHEPQDASNFYNRVAGRDYTQDLGALRALITEAICAGATRGLPNGFMILLAMAGDGMSVSPDPQPGQYNDPQGWTYGFEWLMQNFSRVWSALRGDGGEGPDLTPWIVPMPGYDGVVPVWQPFTCVNRYVQMARAAVGTAGSLALELGNGYNSWSGEGNDWATADGQMFDVVLSEFPYQMGPPDLIPASLLGPEGWLPSATNEQRAPWDQVWQIAGALVPVFHRPADMPANDYPDGIPKRLVGGTPRGPFFYVAWEFDTFGWVRGAPLSQVQRHRAALLAIGAVYVG